MLCLSVSGQTPSKAIVLLAPELFAASLQCTGDEKLKSVAGREVRRRALLYRSPESPALPDGVMGTASCVLNHSKAVKEIVAVFLLGSRA